MQQPGGADAASAVVSLLYIYTSSASGACQRLVGSLHLQLSTLALLLGAAWAALQSAAARLVAALHLHAPASRSRAVGGAARPAAQPPWPQADDAAGGSSSISSSARRRHAPAAAAAAAAPARGGRQAAAIVPRHVPQGPPQSRRLTICIDLDETLLATFRVTQRPRSRASSDDGGCQLVPSHWPAAAGQLQQQLSTTSSGLTASLAALFRSRSAGGGSGNSPSAGTYTLTRRCSDDLSAVAAAGASAWMHYTPPPPPAASSGGGGAAGGHNHPHQQQHPAPHTLAVFERPGCREFLAAASVLGDLVLFTAGAPTYAAPLAELLDPSGRLFAARLYGDACVAAHGRSHVKDLTALGRGVALGRTVLVDDSLFAMLAQPECGLPVLPFRGEAGDGQLLGVVLPLLASLAQVSGDVRPLLGSMFRVREWLASKGYDV